MSLYKQYQNLIEEILSQVDQVNESTVIDQIENVVAIKNEYNTHEKHEVISYLKNAILYYDIIQPLLDDEEVSEIMINGTMPIFIEKKGKIIQTSISFFCEEHILRWIQKVATEVEREINYSKPIMDARLKDGSRVNVVLNPVAIKGPVITIRKFFNAFDSLNELAANGMFSNTIALFLAFLIKNRYNLFLAGGTGSGKTTLLNCLSSCIPAYERVVVIEDATEIQINHLPNCISLETRQDKKESPVNMSALIKNALRMRPDRIIVGEVRGEEVMDMIQAMNTGHEGSISTGHSNSAMDMLIRMEVIGSSFSEINHTLIRKQIISAIDIVIYVERSSDGSRRIVSIEEVIKPNDDYVLKKLFHFSEMDAITLEKLYERLNNKEKEKRYGHSLQ